MPLRAMRTLIPRWRISARSARTSYALSAWSLSGRWRGRPRLPRIGMTDSSSGSRTWASGTFAAEIRIVSGTPLRSHRT
jgi:hypothetical protein